jgi:hypothetical protein
MDADIRNARTGLETLITVSRDRDHWAIENSCHWVLDTLFREDHNPTRRNNRAKNHSTMRRTANNTLKRPPDHSKRKRPSSLPKKQLHAAQDETYLEQCLYLVWGP